MLYVLVLCLLFPSLQAFSVTLRTHNNSTTFPAQQAFNLIVEIKDADRNTSKAVLDGLNQLQLLGQQSSNNMTMINGALSANIINQFTVVASSQGTITVGPAKVHHQGREVASNTLTLTIGPAAQPSQTSQASRGQPSNNGQGATTVKLIANKNEVVLGESIEVSFVMISGQHILEAALGKFEAPDFTIKELKQQPARQELINGSPHTIYEQKYLLTPHKEGSLTVGPLSLTAAIPVARQRRGRGSPFDIDNFFADFMGGHQAERLQLQTNPLKIVVKPLPTKQPVRGIGVFTSYTVSLSTDHAQTHEPLTLTLDLEGNGDLDHITIPKLKLPSSIKYFESKNETSESNTNAPGAGKKHFEFVLQATKPGRFTIPAQEFIYFDTTTRQVKTLHSNPLQVAIEGNASNQQEPTIPPTQGNEQKAPTAQEQPAPDNTPSAPAQPPAALPWWVFVLILFTPLPFFTKQIFAWFKQMQNHLLAKKSRTKAHQQKAFRGLVKQENLDGIYAFFMTYIAQQKNTPSSSLSMDDVETYLTERGFEYDKIDEFITFLGSCSGSKYAHKSLSAPEKEALLSKAQYWFLMLL